MFVVEVEHGRYVFTRAEERAKAAQEIKLRANMWCPGAVESDVVVIFRKGDRSAPDTLVAVSVLSTSLVTMGPVLAEVVEYLHERHSEVEGTIFQTELIA